MSVSVEAVIPLLSSCPITLHLGRNAGKSRIAPAPGLETNHDDSLLLLRGLSNQFTEDCSVLMVGLPP